MNVTAPYNFVPLSAQICTADDLGLKNLPPQDQPETDALSGVIGFTLKCNTPLLVGDGGKDAKKFTRDPDGKPIIPGSSLRGMLRNVLEIASFAGFARFVDDHRVGVRDLGSRLDYPISKTIDNGVYAPKTRAGWLKLSNGKIELTKCEFGRIDHDDLNEFEKKFSERASALAEETDQDKRNAEQLQNAFIHTGVKSLSQILFVQDEPAAHEHRGKKLYYRRAAKTQSEAERNSDKAVSQKRGTLVFTGLPGPNKHMEFFFFDKAQQETPLPEGVWEKFIAVHEQQEKPNKTWEWRRTALYRGEAIPVFWLPDQNGAIAQIGLAMMFKIAADNSMHDLIPANHKKDTIDLPTRIFGRVHETASFKTRVSFGFAHLTSGCTENEHQIIAAKPKPSFVPSYIRQKDFGDNQGTRLLSWQSQKNNGDKRTDKAQYRSYMNWQGRKEELRGWKRYPAQGNAMLGPNEGTGDSSSKVWPIKNETGLSFAGKIRYHNLHPIELGALLWALNWGGNETLRHGLGMGKPFGWGQVWLELQLNKAQEQAIADFEKVMEKWAKSKNISGGWVNSLQLRQLRAMADPEIGATRIESHLKQMVLNPDTNQNHFQDAKAKAAVLPEYDLPDCPQDFSIADKRNVKGGPQNKNQNRPPQRQRPAPAQNPRFATLDGERVKVLSDDGNEASVEIEGDIEVVASSELRYPQ